MIDKPIDVCVIYNPTSGRGRSVRRLAGLRRTWADRAAFWPTSGPGQAEELALQAAREGFATVAAAGGDGTVHEVANGLLRSQRPDVILAVIPTGSANDYASSLGLDVGWWRQFDAVAPRSVDVGIVRAAGRSRYFVNGLGLGFNGQVTLESRRIRRLQGIALYGLAVLRTLCFRYTLSPMTVRINDDDERVVPTLALSLALGQREGNFVVAPGAVLDDGLFDYIHAGPLHRRDLATLLPRLFMGRGLPADHPKLWLGRCRRVRLHSESALVIHTDGELFCVPEDGVQDLDIELLPGTLRVLARLG
ncbi:MAG TPA: diacylglycerol kinase family protein [Gemmataceae bacterium]|nr:diacylglycerol kinase family protein [Gemmataceae bacterium]